MGGCGRDLSSWEHTASKTLASVCSISAHTRPVECIDGRALSARAARLYTADTMGVIKAWDLELAAGAEESGKGAPGRWRAVLRDELAHHRTRINDMVYGHGQLWTGESPSSRP